MTPQHHAEAQTATSPPRGLPHTTMSTPRGLPHNATSPPRGLPHTARSPPRGLPHTATSPTHGLPHSLRLASPMERERRRILSVELRDIAQEVGELPVETPPCQRTSSSDDWTVYNRLTSRGSYRSRVITRSPTEERSHTFPPPPPLSPPKEQPGWGLLPLFHSVRSKLESFAEIFLSPVMSRKDVRPCEPCPQESGGTVQSSTVDPEERAILSSTLEDKSSSSPKTPPNIRLQTETSPSILCRPPLQRHLSCPLLPLTRHKRRLSLDTMERSAEPYSCRRRRHSLGTVEECQKLSFIPFSLSCLRKENHPSVLRQSLYQPNSSVHNEGSPAGQDGEQEDQVTKGSLPDCDFKDPENRTKENKVSNIQIRKRVQRPEEKLTPLGLPKRVRLQKEDFSLEEIYTNKNYHTPTEKRKFETIFEEPIMKGGALILTSQRPLRRTIIFKNQGSAPRKRKKGKAMGRTRRYTTASTGENVNYDLLLQHKLNELEAALQEDTCYL